MKIEYIKIAVFILCAQILVFSHIFNLKNGQYRIEYTPKLSQHFRQICDNTAWQIKMIVFNKIVT